MEARPTHGSIRTRWSAIEQWKRGRPTVLSEHVHRHENNAGETDIRINQNTVIVNRTMEARPPYGPIRTWSCTIEQWRRDRPKDQSEHGHRQENNGGETDLWTNQNTVIDKWTVEARPTYGSIRKRSSTLEQWRRDRLMDKSEHGHRKENNGGETDLQTNQNTVIDKWTVKARPTYQSIRARSSTIEQWMRDRPTDQTEHSHRQDNNEGETDLRTKQNTVIDKRTMKARQTYGPIRTRSSTSEQWRQDQPTDQSEHGHLQVNNGGETDLWINQSTVIDNRTMDARPTYGQIRTRSWAIEQWMRDQPKDQSEYGHAQ